MRLQLLLGAAFGLSLPLPSQTFDMIGVAFGGQVMRIDSTTGATSVLATGALGKNCLANTSDNRLWSVIRIGTISTQSALVLIDPFTGAESTPFGLTNIGDIRAMTGTEQGDLLAIRDVAGADQLVRIDTTTGAVTVIGSTGFGSIQALDDTALGLNAWDLNAGMLRVSRTTGVATDPFPAVAGPSGLQWMATDPQTGSAFVGRATLHPLDLFSGVAGAAVNIAGAPDLRGVEFTTGRFQLTGSACGGVRIGASFSTSSGLALETGSAPHPAGSLGVEIIGFSETQHLGQALPLLLDPLLGTLGCSLNVSIDATRIGFADPAGILELSLPIPPAVAFFQFFVQHAGFDPALPGGMSWSHGVRVRTPL
jgi:hypothetical protein